MNITWRKSPNFTRRELPIKYIILHGTWMDTAEAALERLCCEEAEVSCHYLIDEQGGVTQLVQDDCVAWHAGVSAWGSDVGLNKNSIGIELANKGEGTPYTDSQYDALSELLETLIQKHDIHIQNVLAHSDIAPSRKDDPGSAFNWQRLYEQNLAMPLTDTEKPSYQELLKVGYVGEEADVLKAYALRK